MSNFKPSAAGKGPQNRLKSLKKYRENWDTIFSKKPKKKKK
jgi:hypothetical protein